MPTKKLRCFVASAFGHDDVDEIYEKGVRPVLRSLSVIADRVDQIVHNDDIDDKIIECLQTADLCVADLTYARPSVYYEAGYCTGKGTPVIYLARKDHFRAKDSDPSGNERVHFDLQMKNIVPWQIPDEQFKRKLRSRLLNVLGPITRRNQASTKLAARRAKFASLSLSGRLEAVSTVGDRVLSTAGFKRSRVVKGAEGPVSDFYWLKNGHRVDAAVWPRVSFPLGQLQQFYRSRSMYFPGPEHVRSKSDVRFVLLCSLSAISRDVLSRALFDCEQDEIGAWRPTSSFAADYRFIAVDKIRSSEEFASRLEEIATSIQAQQFAKG